MNELSFIREFGIKDYSNEFQFFSEAVFKNGKKKVEVIEKCFEAVKSKLESEIKLHEDKFDPKEFWKDTVFKNLENALVEVFGFRVANIEPYIEKYRKKENTFESNELNAYVYTIDRYPIDGMLSDDGFYDKTKSAHFHMVLSLGIIKNLEADELTAVLLHEIGHKIDPALATISYTDMNILTKYMTDREGSLTNNEKKRYKSFFEAGLVILVYISVITGMFIIQNIVDRIREKFGNREKRYEKIEKKVKDILSKDNDKFNRVKEAEAYADNFARMYGYGVQLTKALKKLELNSSEYISNIKRELERERIIVYVLNDCIRDEHKTSIHRAKALIKEYENDINDPNTPKAVVKQLEADKKEMELLLDSYTKDFSELQNRVNKIIIESIDKNIE